MQKTKIRSFCCDGDVVEIEFRSDEAGQRYFGLYPDFEESPRFTPNGRPWVNAMQDACEHGSNRFSPGDPCIDCGSCWHFQKESEGDLIGVCDHENKRKTT